LIEPSWIGGRQIQSTEELRVPVSGSCLPRPRVEGVAQAVADEVDGEDGKDHG
jgi:hypothetical protein